MEWERGGFAEHGGGRASLMRGTQGTLDEGLKGPILPDRKQGAWRGLSLGMPRSLGLCRRELRTGVRGI